MRVRTLLAALSLAVSSAAVAPMPAFADGIEPPPVVRHAPRPHRRPAPPPVAPVIAPAPVSNTLALPAAFFTDGGGVGIDVGAGYVGGGGTTIVQGSRSTSI